MNPASRTQLVREGVVLQSAIKMEREEILYGSEEIGMLRSYLEVWLGQSITTLRVDNPCLRLHICEYEIINSQIWNLRVSVVLCIIYFLTTI